MTLTDPPAGLGRLALDTVLRPRLGYRQVRDHVPARASFLPWLMAVFGLSLTLSVPVLRSTVEAVREGGRDVDPGGIVLQSVFFGLIAGPFWYFLWGAILGLGRQVAGGGRHYREMRHAGIFTLLPSLAGIVLSPLGIYLLYEDRLDGPLGDALAWVHIGLGALSVVTSIVAMRVLAGFAWRRAAPAALLPYLVVGGLYFAFQYVVFTVLFIVGCILLGLWGARRAADRRTAEQRADEAGAEPPPT